MSKERIETLALALCIAVLPPLWAVISPYLSIQVGGIALICTGLYVASGNDNKNALKISIGFLLGDLWAVIALKLMAILPFGADLNTFTTLFILGFIGVIIASKFSKIIYCPSLLCGWAIGLSFMGPLGVEGIGNMPIQIGVSMLVGVWYVGVFLDIVHKKLIKIFL